jgi:hypothetical protein
MALCRPPGVADAMAVHAQEDCEGGPADFRRHVGGEQAPPPDQANDLLLNRNFLDRL